MDYKLEFQEQLSRLENSFTSFFREHDFKFKSSKVPIIIYENSYSELIFDYDNYGLRFGDLVLSSIVYKNKSNGAVYTIETMLKKLCNLKFIELFEHYFSTKGFTFYDSHREIIHTYLNKYISDADFSWAENINADYINPT
ncbi:hypothetical protein ACLI1A_11605 [Flavobacterium sp. RHBU_3]|uniref:hypothetical protein n=1 Tax=Flavobacterium sp. RHBU_3 TaxID=3391184 RepID=UPI003984F145